MPPAEVAQVIDRFHLAVWAFLLEVAGTVRIKGRNIAPALGTVKFALGKVKSLHAGAVNLDPRFRGHRFELVSPNGNLLDQFAHLPSESHLGGKILGHITVVY